jgi:hypothetical protein
MSTPNKLAKPRYHDTDRGYLDHWQRIGPILAAIHRQELRCQGTEPTDWRIVDSLLQLGYLHGNRNPQTGLIEWQARLAAAYAKNDSAFQTREEP